MDSQKRGDLTVAAQLKLLHQAQTKSTQQHAKLTSQLQTQTSKVLALQSQVTKLHARNEAMDKRLSQLEVLVGLLGSGRRDADRVTIEDVDIEQIVAPPTFWRKIAQAVQLSQHTLRTMKPDERRAVIRVLGHVKSLNDRGIYPADIQSHNPSIAVQAQNLAVRLPCVLESWPTYRVTQLGRLLLRDERAAYG